jgi:integrase
MMPRQYWAWRADPANHNRRTAMAERRVTVWVQRFKDRATLMLQWLDPETGRRKSKSAGTTEEGEAEQARADLEYELNHGRYQEVSRMTWETFRKLFEQEFVVHRRENTRRNYRVMMDLFEQVCHPTRIGAVSERTISAFMAGLRKLPGYNGQPMQLSTIKVRLQFLHTALKWAADQKLIPTCPKFPAVKVPKKRPQPVATESFERMLEKAPDAQTRAYLLCGWLGGLRLNEALALEWDETDKAPWLNFAEDRIVLPAGFVKGDEDQWVPLDPVLREALNALPRKGQKVFHFVAKDGHPLTDIAVSAQVRGLAKAAGVKLTMKSLRKGFGCRYAGKVPAQVLQKLMRHASIKTTMDYYANVDDAAIEAVLGSRRNSLRNSEAARRISEANESAGSSYREGSSD